MGGAIGQQGSGRGSVLAMLGLVAAATAGYFFAIPGGTTGGMLFKESTAAGTPAAGERVVYAKSDGLYQKNSSGTETALGGALTGINNPSSGVLTGANDTAVVLNAGPVSAGTTGKDLTLTASAAKASSGANGGNIILTPGAKDGAGVIGSITLGNADYPQQVNVGSGVAICSQSGKLLAVSGDGLGNFVDFKCQGLVCTSTTNPVNFGTVFSIDDAGAGVFNGKDFYFGTGTFDTTPASLHLEASHVIGVRNGSFPLDGGLGWIQNGAGSSYATADQTIDSTTLTADDTISLNLEAGRKYKFQLIYNMTPGDTAADGFKMDLNGGTATMTGMYADVQIRNASGQDVAVTNPIMTSLTTSPQVATSPTTAFTVEINGFLEVNAAGTFKPKWAKVADAGTGFVKKKYSNIQANDYP